MKKLTKNIVNNRLLDKGRELILIGEYINSDTKSLFRCGNNHTWLSTPHNIFLGNGCPFCANQAPLSKDIVNHRLKENCRNILMIGDYDGALKKSLFVCDVGHEWMARPGHILSLRRGCSICAKHGFNSGKSAFIYLLGFDDYIKYGITNDLDTRLSKHKRTGLYDIIMTRACDGTVALEWENMIKKTFGGRYVNKFVMTDGWTETLSTEHTQSIVKTMTIIDYPKNSNE